MGIIQKALRFVVLKAFCHILIYEVLNILHTLWVVKKIIGVGQYVVFFDAHIFCRDLSKIYIVF